MVAILKDYLQKQDEKGIISLLQEYPKIIEENDDSGNSVFAILAYSGLSDVYELAITLKNDFTFYEAIMAGKIKEVKEAFVLENSIINAYAPDGFTPISLAAYFNKYDIACFLLDNGANPNTPANNPSKVNALHAAVAKENVSMVQLLIAYEANTNAIQMQGVTPLHSAVHRGNLDIVKLLLKHKALINVKMDNGDTPLTIADREGHTEIAAYLTSKCNSLPN